MFPAFTEAFDPATRSFPRHDSFTCKPVAAPFRRAARLALGPREFHRICLDDLSQNRTRGSL